ncbi:MAG: MFS transporter [Anaerolineae bacterium]|nr:MFS transporter [Anaerolineae bacterium]
MTSLAHSRTGSAARARTLSALQNHEFRRYFIGQLISLSGTWMQTVAQGWLVFHLTQSELWLGVVACAAGLPSLILSPFGGVLIDRLPRRNVLIFSQTAQMTLALILAALTFTNQVQVWHIVVLAALLGIVNAVDAPSRQAIIADLVGHDKLNSGIALNAIMFNGSRVVGPAVAGIALTSVGPAWCFLLNGLSFLAVIAMLLTITPKRPEQTSDGFHPLLRLKEGLRFSRRHPTIWPLLLLAATASIFTANISQLMPAFADTVLNSPKEAYAAMSTATGLGAVVAAALMASLGQRYGRGRVVTVMAGFVLVAVLLVTRTTSIPVAIGLMGMFGFGIILEFVTVNTLIQSEVPDAFRGRVMSLYTLTWFGLAPFGALTLGALAQVIGTPDAMLIYALIGGVLSVTILLRSPHVRRLR